MPCAMQGHKRVRVSMFIISLVPIPADRTLPVSLSPEPGSPSATEPLPASCWEKARACRKTAVMNSVSVSSQDSYTETPTPVGWD